MPNWNIDNLRFSQLRLFKEIFETGNLSIAAKNLNTSQSSASKHLKSMREYFKDDLFVRTTNDMKPTAKAVDIMANIQNILLELDGISGQTNFDPRQIYSRIAISLADELQHALIPKLTIAFKHYAPNAQLAFCLHNKNYDAKKLENGTIRQVIAVNCTAPDHLMQKKIYQDEFVILMAHNNPLTQKTLSISDYAKAQHLSVMSLMELNTYVERGFTKHGFERKIDLVVPTFSLVAELLNNSDLILTCPKRIATSLSKSNNLAIVKPPLEIQQFSYYQFWHKRYNKDPMRIWLKNLVHQVLQENP